jgi:hypothetical protein
MKHTSDRSSGKAAPVTPLTALPVSDASESVLSARVQITCISFYKVTQSHQELLKDKFISEISARENQYVRLENPRIDTPEVGDLGSADSGSKIHRSIMGMIQKLLSFLRSLLQPAGDPG